MTPGEVTATQDAGCAASNIAAICALMAQALAADPATCLIGEAVEGIGALAAHLSRALLTLAEPD